jgi:mycothiol synthase
MESSTIEIKTFDWRGASETEYAALNAFRNQMRAEAYPADPPMPLAEEIAALRNTPAVVVSERWAAWHGADIVASGRVYFRTADNPHLVEMSVEVLPAWRRQGLARRLLSRLVEMPRREQRRLILAWTTDRCPAGEAFARRVGAKRGMVERVSQLELSELNHELLRAWLARAPERASGFYLDCWVGAFPDSDIEAVAELFHVMNSAPRESLDIEDEHFTVDEMRQWEQSLRERGVERWTMVARERATGKLAGFTEVFWNPNRAALAQQGGTGVWPQYRDKGLGRWLKAAMIEKLLRERPQVKRIRTDNANSNEPMLKINYELGFKHYMTNSAWQVETEQVLTYRQR